MSVRYPTLITQDVYNCCDFFYRNYEGKLQELNYIPIRNQFARNFSISNASGIKSASLEINQTTIEILFNEGGEQIQFTSFSNKNILPGYPMLSITLSILFKSDYDGTPPILTYQELWVKNTRIEKYFSNIVFYAQSSLGWMSVIGSSLQVIDRPILKYVFQPVRKSVYYQDRVEVKLATKPNDITLNRLINVCDFIDADISTCTVRAGFVGHTEYRKMFRGTLKVSDWDKFDTFVHGKHFLYKWIDKIEIPELTRLESEKQSKLMQEDIDQDYELFRQDYSLIKVWTQVNDKEKDVAKYYSKLEFLKGLYSSMFEK